ncbi:ABC transporter permease [Clostridium sp.]|uniref:ABC transporter permease n=1 Tax=Clostridium sp. TaxID=1506 RepID=UPI00290C9C5E|nr:ABC transporter permease [Clostridium sp.]MDU5106407.1 ABC transporter permease [Clostridium sp.]
MDILSFGKSKKYDYENIKVKENNYKGYYSKSFRIFRKNKEAMLCLFIIVAISVVAIFAPFFAPYDPNAQSLADMLQKPSAKHLFGTDEYGRDILSRIIYGVRISLSVGVISQGIASVIGFFMGVMAGYFGGWVDRIISFLIQVFSSFPYILFAIALIFVLGPGILNLFIALGLLSWANIARMIRGQVMQLKKKEYIEACIINGGSGLRVIMKHLLPNCISTMIVLITLGIPSAIINEAALSFLGLGVQAPASSWGSMISLSQTYIRSNPSYSIIPGIAIIIVVLSFNIVGDGLRDALDHKMKS